MKSISGPSGKLAVDDGGSGGLPVIFLHSFGGSVAQWSPQLHHLRKSRRAVAFDLRGHGKSDAPADNDYSIEAFSNDVGVVVDALDIKRFVLVGHSLGGNAAIAYSSNHADRVAGLVVEGTSGKMDDAQAKPLMATLDADFDKTMEQIWTRLLKDATQSTRDLVMKDRALMSKEAAKAMIKANFEYNPVPAITKYSGPKLSIKTAMDDVPFALDKQVSGLPVKSIAGTSHWIHLDKPDEFNVVLDEFLSKLK